MIDLSARPFRSAGRNNPPTQLPWNHPSTGNGDVRASGSVVTPLPMAATSSSPWLPVRPQRMPRPPTGCSVAPRPANPPRAPPILRLRLRPLCATPATEPLPLPPAPPVLSACCDDPASAACGPGSGPILQPLRLQLPHPARRPLHLPVAVRDGFCASDLYRETDTMLQTLAEITEQGAVLNAARAFRCCTVSQVMPPPKAEAEGDQPILLGASKASAVGVVPGGRIRLCVGPPARAGTQSPDGLLPPPPETTVMSSTSSRCLY